MSGTCEHRASFGVDKSFNRWGKERGKTSDRGYMCQVFFFNIPFINILKDFYFISTFVQWQPSSLSDHVGLLCVLFTCAPGYQRTSSPITAILANKWAKQGLVNFQGTDLKGFVLAEWRSKCLFEFSAQSQSPSPLVYRQSQILTV